MLSRTTSIRIAAVFTALAVWVTACDVQRNPGTGVDNPVAQVHVFPESIALDPSESHQFQAYGRTSAGDSVPVAVRWTASGGTITSGGMYTADTSATDAIITATLTSTSLSGTSNVKKRRVVRIVITPKSTTVQTGGAQQFAAYGLRNTGDSVSVSVTYAATGGAISGGGAYTAGQTAGTYRAIAKQNSSSLADTSVVTVAAVPVASVAVTPTMASVQVGQTAQLAATPMDANGSPLAGRVVTWATSNAAVATVSGSGLVTGSAVGSATISATSEGQTGAAPVTVSIVPVASVSVSPATAGVQAGQTAQLTATPRDASGNALSGRAVTWSSSAPAVATVGGAGLVTGVAAGSATISATSEGQSGTAAVTVTAPVANPGTVTNLSVAGVTANSMTLAFTEVTNGASQPANYDVRWTAGAMNWASANEVAQGTCAVPVAGTAIGATRSCTVLGLASGTSYQFQLVAFRGTLNVDAVFGGLSNVASGTTTNSTAPVASVTLSPASVSLGLGGSQQLTAVLKDASGNILTGRTVTWTSSAPLLASVSGSGLVSALLAGVATITATSEGISNTAAVTITTGGGGSSHEPAGFRAFNDQPWSLLTGSGWNYLRRTSSKDDAIIPDLSALRSAPDVLQIVFTTDMIHDTEPSVHWISMPGLQEVYTVWWIKVSPNWQCSPAGCGKMTFLFTNGAGQVYTNLYNSASGQGAPYRVGVNTEWAPYGQRIWMPNATTTPINPGEWHKIEVYYKWETTSGAANGIIRWWVDGVLNGDYTNVQYPSSNFVEFQFAPTLQNPPSAEQYMYIDHTYVSVP